MESRNIDDQIREYYNSRQLSANARAKLTAMIRTRNNAARTSRSFWISAGLAASFVVVITAIALWSTLFRQPAAESPQQLAVTLARQAALGHNERQELEFHVEQCAELRARMKSLDFTPIEPAMMRNMNMQIVGARYTTIRGAIAAQILFRDEKGVPCTLYEVRPVDKLALVPISEHQVDGVRVNVWREKGLLMVLARPMA